MANGANIVFSPTQYDMIINDVEMHSCFYLDILSDLIGSHSVQTSQIIFGIFDD